MSYAELKHQPRILQSLTGLSLKEFEALLPSFGNAQDSFVKEEFLRGARKRAYGGGRNARLKSLENKLLFILVYFRLHPTQKDQGCLFEIRQTQTSEWVHRLTRVVSQVLDDELQLPERRPERLPEVLKCCPV